MTFSFRDHDAFLFALTSDVIPGDVMMSPGRFGRSADGALWIAPDNTLDSSRFTSLRQFGIDAQPEVRTDGQRMAHWLYAVPLVRHEFDITPQTPILFELSDVAQLPAFVNEILRLGNDRIAVWSELRRAWVRVVGPPLYTLLSALDPTSTSAPSAYVEKSPNVWVAIGHAHPFERQLDIAQDHWLLLRPLCHWEVISPGDFQDIESLLRIAAPRQSDSWHESVTAEPLALPLQLSAGAIHRAPTLWVVDTESNVQIDALVQSMTPENHQRFSFTEVTREGRSIIVLKLRPAKKPAPTISLKATAFREYLGLPNLFVPIGSRISPPLRRETTRKLLANDLRMITWIVNDDCGSLQRESVEESAFRPLMSWPDHVIERCRTEIEQWICNTEFAFAGALIEEEPVPTKVATPAPAKPKPAKADVVARQPAHESVPRAARRGAPLVPVSSVPEPPISHTDARQRLSDAEQQFLAIDGPLDHPSRQALWPTLGRFNAAIQQPAEAALAWTYAMWHVETPPETVLWGWVWSENALAKAVFDSQSFDRRLSATTATPSDVRAVAAVSTWAAWQSVVPSAFRQRLPRLQSYLQANDHLLPIRAAWLTWFAVCRAAGGDDLGLARVRDRILGRLLEHGLSAETDLPAFLRFAGRANAEHLRQVRDWASDARNRLRQWYAGANRGIDSLESDTTAGYIDLAFAFAFARLGEAVAARGLLRQAESVLGDVADDSRDAHFFLMQAYSWRVEQVLNGRPHGGPLPNELLDYLKHIHQEASTLPRTSEYNTRRTCAYAAERMREQSRILEPQEQFDPYRHTRREGHELIAQALRLPDVHDPNVLSARMQSLIAPAESRPGLYVQLLSLCVPLAGRLDEARAARLLERVPKAWDAAGPTHDIPAAETRLRLIERSLFFAAHFDRAELVATFVERMVALFDVDATLAALETSGPAIGQTLRSLRKLGLRDETIRILDRVETRLLKGQPCATSASRLGRAWPAALNNLLYVAAGWLFFDRRERAEPILTAAADLLGSAGRPTGPTVQPAHYVQIICNSISALGFLPLSEARSRISNLFEPGFLDRLPNTFTTAPFYSRFHLNVSEAIVLTLASDEFSLGPIARRWLDEDEYIVRQRIHHDVRQAVRRGQSP